MLWAAEKDLLKSAQDFFENGLLHNIIMQNRCCNACFLSISVHYAASISNIKGMWGLIEDASERDRFTVLCGNVAKFTGHTYTLQDDSALKPTRIQDPSYIVSIISRHMDVKLNENVSTSHLRLTSEMDWRGQTAEIFQKEKQMRCHLSQRVSSPKCHTRRDGSEMLKPPQKNRRRRRNRNNPHTAVAVPQSAHSTGHTHTADLITRSPPQPHSVWECECVCVCVCVSTGGGWLSGWTVTWLYFMPAAGLAAASRRASLTWVVGLLSRAVHLILHAFDTLCRTIRQKTDRKRVDE